MTHWGWYWKIKRKHKPKALCSRIDFSEIDSFSMFKNKELVQLVRDSKDRLSLEIPQYELKAVLLDDDSLNVTFEGGSYVIPVEKKSCNFGGYSCFFRCPLCTKRMRKLYCIKGQYLCRKCGNLGYYTQRIRPSTRYLLMSSKIKKFIESIGGDLYRKPPRMSNNKFQKLRESYFSCERKWHQELNKELRAWFGERAETYLDDAFD